MHSNSQIKKLTKVQIWTAMKGGDDHDFLTEVCRTFKHLHQVHV